MYTVITCMLIAFVFDIRGSDATTTIPSGSSTAVLAGNNATIPCSSTHGSTSIVWIFSTAPIVLNCVSQNFVLYSTVIDVATNSCDIIIKNATSTSAGLYQCTDSDFTAIGAYLTVVDVPVGNQNNSTYIVGGDSLLIACNVSYTIVLSGSTPSLGWIYSPDLQVSITGSTSSNLTWSSMSISVPQGPYTIPSVTCYVYFPTSVVFPTPANWSSFSLQVSYCPQVQINPAGGDVLQNSTFLCTANAHPPVSLYNWTVISGTGFSSAQNFTLTSLGAYEINCTATNYLRGQKIDECSRTVRVNGTSHNESTLNSSPASVLVISSAKVCFSIAVAMAALLITKFSVE